MSDSPANPGQILSVAHGAWASFALATAVEHEIFTHLGDESLDVAALAERAGLSPRGLQALVDALVGYKLLAVEQGSYRNTPDGRVFLVKGQPTYLGDFVRVHLDKDFVGDWLQLPEAVKTGAPAEAVTAVEENSFWEGLVRAIAPLTVPCAQQSAAELKVADAGACRILDIGGGSGMFSLTWLGENPEAEATQLDWANVNRVAREYAEKMGHAARFSTQDGDFNETDLGEGRYDFVIFSHIAHQLSPAGNIEMYKRIKRALKPGGTLVINDFVLDNARTGNPFSLLFNCNMLLHTPEGASYREDDYRSWLDACEFKEVDISPTDGPPTLVYAKI